MKQLLYKLGTKTGITLAMLFLVFSPFQGLVAQADTPKQDDTTDSRNALATTPVLTTDSGSATAASNPTTTTTPGATVDAAASTGGDSVGCSVLSGDGFAICLTNIVYVFTVGIGSGFAYTAAYFFDLAIQLSLNGGAYALTFISTGWTTARDLGNMAFLFILLYIAFQIMFSAETSSTIPLLAGVVVVALLVNFSFFFTRLVIDAGNIVSIQFYNSIQAPSLASSGSNAGVASLTGITSLPAAGAAALNGSAANTKDLTASIMGMLQLQNLFNTDSFQSFKKTNPGFLVTTIALTFLYITAGIMFWLLTVMFVTTGVKFLIRIVILWFLIIFSPLAFVARAVPQFKTYFDKWRGLLISHAFYPVAFMFIFLILTNFANQMSCTGSTSGGASCNGLISGIFNGLSNTNSSSIIATMGYAVANVGLRLGFVIAILYLGMQASQKVSVMGGEYADKAGKWAGGKFIGAFGTSGRISLGHAAYSAGQSTVMKQWAARDGLVGRNLWRGLNKVGGASFDARAPLGIKGANKGGYKGSVDAKMKSREEEGKKFVYTETQKENNEKAIKEAAAQNNANAAAAKQKAEREFERAHADNSAEIARMTTLRAAAADAEKEADGRAEALVKAGKKDTPEWKAVVAEKEAHETTRKGYETNLADLSKITEVLNKKKADRVKELTPAEKVVEKLEDSKKVYADSIAGNGPLGRFGNMSRLGAWIPSADREASIKMKKGKNKKDEVWDELLKAAKEEVGKPEKKEATEPDKGEKSDH